MGHDMDDWNFFTNYVTSSNKYVFSAIAFVLFVAFSTVNHTGNLKSQIVVLTFSTWLGYIAYQFARSDARNSYQISQHIAEMEQSQIHQTGLVFKNQVDIATTPKTFVHLRRREDVMKIANELQPYTIYDAGAITSVFTLLERFFEIYDGVIKGSHSCDDSYASLTDLRSELMNQVTSLEFNVPPKDVPFMVELARQLHAKLSRFTKIASRKCEAMSITKGTYAFGTPSGIDASKSGHEMY